jgi:RNA polymerase sigma-70 factor (ECF subfamily)
MHTVGPSAVTPPSDEELVVGILAGDTAAFELLMRRHNQRLFRVARSVLRESGGAEDVVQETYLRAYRSLRRFEGRSSVATWLSRIALHEALRARRRRRRWVAMEPTTMDQSPAGTPPDPVHRGEERAMLVHALDSLPAKLRAVVMLRLVEGLSTAEAAASLRLSESDVKVSLHRAKRRLAEALEQQAVEQLRAEFSFAHERCDRIVAGVFSRLGVR